ncbi:MAG: signal recognition particle-docking protein FtsY [Phycisphaerae bacterium]|nr:signal recognition particle-docking protein FtsY [Phycisphaerae bacterium]
MGFFGKALAKLKTGLTKTRNVFLGGLKAILPAGRKIDEELLDKLEEQLIAADIGVRTTMRIIEDLKIAYREKKIATSEDVLAALKNEMKMYWPPADRSLHFAPSGPTVILVAGVNGVGKTTSIAKLAQHLTDQGKKVMLAACDTFRAAAVEQLTIWATRTGVQIVKHQQGADPAAVAFDACEAAVARNVDVMLVDTAGRIHTKDHLMRELGKIKRVVGNKIPGAPHEVLLVLDATTGQNAISQAKTFTDAAGVTGIFLAKLDGTAKGGIVVAIRNEVSLPVKFIGVGEKTEDIEPFDPETFVEALFE